MNLEILDIVIEAAPLAIAVLFVLNFIFKKGIRQKSNNYLSLFFVSFILVQIFLAFSGLTDDKYGKLINEN